MEKYTKIRKGKMKHEFCGEDNTILCQGKYSNYLAIMQDLDKAERINEILAVYPHTNFVYVLSYFEDYPRKKSALEKPSKLDKIFFEESGERK